MLRQCERFIFGQVTQDSTAKLSPSGRKPTAS
jgi:hypothetical protein